MAINEAAFQSTYRQTTFFAFYPNVVLKYLIMSENCCYGKRFITNRSDFQEGDIVPRCYNCFMFGVFFSKICSFNSDLRVLGKICLAEL